METTALEFGIVGIALIVMWKLLALVQMWWITKNGKIDSVAYMNELQCRTDPKHFERVKRTEMYAKAASEYAAKNEPAMEAIRKGVPAGAFGCTWKDRDEVKDFIYAMKENTKATNALVIEIRKQNGRQ